MRSPRRPTSRWCGCSRWLPRAFAACSDGMDTVRRCLTTEPRMRGAGTPRGSPVSPPRRCKGARRSEPEPGREPAGSVRAGARDLVSIRPASTDRSGPNPVPLPRALELSDRPMRQPTGQVGV
jgi:hypothetical protein